MRLTKKGSISSSVRSLGTPPARQWMAAGLAGFGMAGGTARNKVHVFGFAGLLALSVYVIMELEYPRVGLIRADQMDHLLIELRADMD